MDTGSRAMDKVETGKRGGKLGSMLPNGPMVDRFVPRTDHNPRELRSWAKRTGFVSTFSGEATSSVGEKNESARFDLEKGLERRGGGSSPKIEIDPILGRTRPNREIEVEPITGTGKGEMRTENEGVLRFRDGAVRGEERRRSGIEPLMGGAKEDEREVTNVKRSEKVDGAANRQSDGDFNGNAHGVPLVSPAAEPKMEDDRDRRDEDINVNIGEMEATEREWGGPSGMKLGPTENPGYVPLIYYGLQHFLSLVGSVVFIPLIMVPAMGGTDKDTATVISTLLLVSGITTILHSYFGTRLPLVQGSSFVYLAPALIIMNAQEYRNLTEHKFRHIMRELQGAIIVSSIFQSILGFSGLMSLFLRLINPLVVAPTVAAIGLAFFSYGFPQAGSCVEISIPHIVLLLIFTLVPLSVMIIWAYAFFLTAGGAYNFTGCSPDVPSSNIIVDACRRHAYTMKHCRTDVSSAWRTAAWVRIPYPLQWGVPIFHIKTSIIMIMVSLVSSVDSIGTYHTVALHVASKPPTPGIVSRGIALEGFCSILAGLWGTGAGSTTLTENVHTIHVTKVANRRALVVGAVFLIFVSFIGKVGAVLASIPLALAASVLCFTWALTVALGLSTLQYSQTASIRNMTIVGVSLFLGLSIPAYFQQFQSETSLILPSYLVPYAAASNGPTHTGNKQFDFVFNALMSLNMVVTFLIAIVLENTVPGSRQERGVYIWSHAEDIKNDPSLVATYSLPKRFLRLFCRSKCL
ncbi:nucleobase-ascorbate transporter 11 isoform X2 [Benincasa hispida]|uniref:nucleobase-ascorbate transporter 11 isoform X2 n=1 Tax=Benincasa hispida TaxID=102211 RepID=UPI0019029881|nr:nucleobase-ascorbate transporter 11 isoform X2 [Benincasa hispida]